MKLFSWSLSTAAFRVRIALNLKGMEYDQVPVDLRAAAQHGPGYRAMNPHRVVPTVIDGPVVLHQSVALLEYLEEVKPLPALLPSDPVGRARVRALVQLMASDIHPLLTPRVTEWLAEHAAMDRNARRLWSQHWIARGFGALETMLKREPETGRFAHGDQPTLADVCLVPEWLCADRMDVDLKPYPTLQAIVERCLAIAAFQDARPERQPDFG